MKGISQKEQAKAFLKMHHDEEMLVIPNAWDVGSAVVFENKGFSAVATTSAGIAYSMGYPDGEKLEFKDLLSLTERISNRVSIPLSVDLDTGYSNAVEGIVNNVQGIVEAGAVGVNIEDGIPGSTPELKDLAFQKEVFCALSELKNQMDIPFIINARTCVCWLKVAEPKEALKIAIDRCNAFAEAGADCVFIPGLLKEPEVARLVNEISLPLNIIANPEFGNIKDLQQLGVKRYSLGSGAVRAVYGRLVEIATDLIENQSIKKMVNHDFSYSFANEFFRTK